MAAWRENRTFHYYLIYDFRDMKLLLAFACYRDSALPYYNSIRLFGEGCVTTFADDLAPIARHYTDKNGKVDLLLGVQLAYL